MYIYPKYFVFLTITGGGGASAVPGNPIVTSMDSFQIAVNIIECAAASKLRVILYHA